MFPQTCISYLKTYDRTISPSKPHIYLKTPKPQPFLKKAYPIKQLYNTFKPKFWSNPAPTTNSWQSMLLHLFFISFGLCTGVRTNQPLHLAESKLKAGMWHICMVNMKAHCTLTTRFLRAHWICNTKTVVKQPALAATSTWVLRKEPWISGRIMWLKCTFAQTIVLLNIFATSTMV